MSPEELAEVLRDLQDRQQALQQQLDGLLQQLQQQGMADAGRLGQAEQSMGQAAGRLGQSRPGDATRNQSDALEALRQGAQQLAQQLAQQQGQQPGQGQGQGPGQPRGNQFGLLNQQRNQTDPLGRPNRAEGPDLGTDVKVPDEIDTQRAREILETIRKRLGEAQRPALELDYLGRLLQQF